MPTTVTVNRERLINLINGLEAAYLLMERAAIQNHSAHFDRTGQHGRGCKECIQAQEQREKAVSMFVRILGRRPTWRTNSGDNVD